MRYAGVNLYRLILNQLCCLLMRDENQDSFFRRRLADSQLQELGLVFETSRLECRSLPRIRQRFLCSVFSPPR